MRRRLRREARREPVPEGHERHEPPVAPQLLAGLAAARRRPGRGPGLPPRTRSRPSPRARRSRRPARGTRPMHFPLKKPALIDWSLRRRLRQLRPRPAPARLPGLREVCSACHGLKYVAFRNLGEHGRPRLHRGAGRGAGGRVHDPGRAERRRRHVRASRPAVRPLPVARSRTTRRRRPPTAARCRRTCR